MTAFPLPSAPLARMLAAPREARLAIEDLERLEARIGARTAMALASGALDLSNAVTCARRLLAAVPPAAFVITTGHVVQALAEAQKASFGAVAIQSLERSLVQALAEHCWLCEGRLPSELRTVFCPDLPETLCRVRACRRCRHGPRLRPLLQDAPTRGGILRPLAG